MKPHRVNTHGAIEVGRELGTTAEAGLRGESCAAKAEQKRCSMHDACHTEQSQ